MHYFIQGLLMGFAYLAPIGVQNLYVINSALNQRLLQALITASIVIFFDITLAIACFWGIGTILQQFVWLEMIILLIGSLILIYIGITLLKAKVTTLSTEESVFSITKSITTACVVTWINPQAIIDGTMMLGAFQVTLPADAGISFLSGVITASFLWFYGITIIVSLFKDSFTPIVMQWINRICAVIIIFYGIKLLYDFVSLYV